MLELLPEPHNRRLAVRLTKDAQRQVRGGHPWIFESSITQLKSDGDCGDMAVVFDDRRRFVAIGLYDPTSPIRIRVLHQGSPLSIDAAFWSQRLAAAINNRQRLLEDPTTTGYRLVHGENDQIPGLVIDRYDETIVVRLDTAAWLPHLNAVLTELRTLLPTVERAVLRTSRTAAPAATAMIGVAASPDASWTESPTLFGPPIEGPIEFLEHGLRFEADVVRGQKTGHFLDQRQNRVEVGRLAKGRSVLDVFSSTGGFTVHAAAGGARRVHSIDASPHAIEAVEKHLALNADRPSVATAEATSTVGDAFEVMTQLANDGQRFEVVIVDPPSFASKQADVERALDAYARLTTLALDIITPGGTLVQSSCSSRVPSERFYPTVLNAGLRAGRRLQEVARSEHGEDHPVGFAQGSYLKTIFARASS